MKEEKHANKRNQIIASTLKLIGEVGYEKASIRAICESASISIGTFYHYFKDKGDLPDALFPPAHSMAASSVIQTSLCPPHRKNVLQKWAGRFTVFPKGLSHRDRKTVNSPGAFTHLKQHPI